MSNEPWFSSFVLTKAMACVPRRKISRHKEPDNVSSVHYLALLKLHVSRDSLDKAFDGGGLFHRKDCLDVKDSIFNTCNIRVLIFIFGSVF